MLPTLSYPKPIVTIIPPLHPHPDMTFYLLSSCSISFSNAANPITDALAKEGILRAARSLRVVVANGQGDRAS